MVMHHFYHFFIVAAFQFSTVIVSHCQGPFVHRQKIDGEFLSQHLECYGHERGNNFYFSVPIIKHPPLELSDEASSVEESAGLGGLGAGSA